MLHNGNTMDNNIASQLRAAIERRESFSRFDWSKMARPAQRLPAGNWRTWLILAGRGFGKTRTGAETCRIWARDNATVNVVAPTSDDARDVMIEGPAGILSVCSNDDRPAYYPARRTLEWPSGCKTLIFSADEPERLRGKAHHKVWCDELSAWRYLQDAWDQLSFGLRMGTNPQSVITTTPKPVRLLKQLIASPTTIVTRGSTYENRANLAEGFFSDIISRYEGTRLGRQELLAEVLTDNPGALWNLTEIDADRVAKLPMELESVVVAIDPSGTSDEDSDECGIVLAGRDGQRPPHYYVLADLSLQASPDSWARKAVMAYHAHRADRVVAEGNFGADMVETLLRNVDPNVSFKKVIASRGKLIRAEPVAALYEQHRVHHVGVFSTLEDQMCNYVPGSSESPDRMDALVWAISEVSEGAGGDGFMRYLEMHHDKLAAEDDEVARRASTGVLPTVTPAAEVPHPFTGVVTIPARPGHDHFGNSVVGTPEPTFSDPLEVLQRPAKRSWWR